MLIYDEVYQTAKGEAWRVVKREEVVSGPEVYHVRLEAPVMVKSATWEAVSKPGTVGVLPEEFRGKWPRRGDRHADVPTIR